MMAAYSPPLDVDKRQAIEKKWYTSIEHMGRMVVFLRRNAIQDLIKWKSSEERKPMVLKGARQVGKTWLMKEFGKTCYESYVYLNFDEEDELKSIFEVNKNPHRILELLSMLVGERFFLGRH